MVLVAVAGGTSKTLGRSIVTAIGQTDNTPIILSRQREGEAGPTSKCGAEIRYVDYTNHQSMVDAVKDVHTVISVMLIPGPEWATHQIALLHAAQAAGVKRFAPSEWEFGPEADGHMSIVAPKLLVRDELSKARAQGMECSRFSNGTFMNYLGFGYDYQDNTEKEDRMMEGLDDMETIWNIQNGTAEIPIKEDGSFPTITLTKIGDIGRFVAASCELPDGMWVPNMCMVGETIGCGDVNELIEEIVGKKLEVTTVTKQQLQERADSVSGAGSTWPEMVKKMMAEIGLMMLEDDKPGKAILEPVVNELCPHVQPTTVREYLTHLAEGS